MRVPCVALSLTFVALSLIASAQNPKSISQLGQFTAPDLYYQSYFGWSAAIAGDTVVVSAPSDEFYGGAFYVYEKPSSGWATVAPTAELGYECNTGARLAISADGGTIAALGSQCYGGLGFGATVISVWVRPASGWQSTWTPTAIIVNGNNQPNGSPCGNNFALSTDGKTLVCSDEFGWAKKNYLYFFDRPSTGWASTTKPNLTVSISNPVNQISMNGNILALEDTGGQALQVFQRTSNGLTQLANLTTSDGTHFGYGMAMDSQTIVVQGIIGNAGPGKVYVYSKPSSGWTNATETAQITAAASTSTGLQFGYSIAKSGNALLVGGDPAAYMYFKPAAGWQTTSQPNATIVSTDPYQGDFGGGVAMQGTTLVIGDPLEGQNYNENGAAYIFTAK
ncbi:MAG: hypothetical protein WAN03_20045 [Candidatus Sulfotelmatobacter sp.]